MEYVYTDRLEYFHPAWLIDIYHQGVVSISHGIDAHTPLQVSRLGAINSSPLVAQLYVLYINGESATL